MSFNSSKINITFNQKNIYMTDKLNGNSKVNNIFGIININKEFNFDKTIKLVNKVIENNDALRISVVEENNDLYQVINEFKYEEIDSVEISKEDNVDKIIEDFSNDVIDINDKVLYKFKIINIENNKGIILVKLHHIISDAWSFSKIAEQFIEMYENNELSQENKMSFYDYTLKEEEYLQSEKYKKDEEFFNEYLDGIQEKVSFKEADSRVETYEASRYQIKLDEDLNNKINEFCKENKISSYVLFLTMLSVYMYRTLDKNDFVIGTPVLGRSNFAEKQIVGMFVSTIPLRIKITENMSVVELAKNISMDLMKIFRHQKYPYLKMLKNVHKNTEIKNNLYDVILSFQNARINNNYDNKYTTTWNFSEAMYDEMQIHIVDMDNTGTLAINYDYLKSHFEEIEIEYLHKRFVTMIEEFISKDDVSVEDIDILCESDKESIESINDTKLEYDSSKTFIDLFENIVTKNPEKLALVFKDKKISYSELDCLSNRFARFLIDKGVNPYDKVGLLLQRDENVVISMLACLKLGITYIPVDSRYPDERIEYILQNSKCKYVLINNDRKIEYNSLNISNLEYLQYSDEKIDYTCAINDICYMIYTSGSTGLPKGVLISNKNLINFLIAFNKELNLNLNDVFLSITTISFDIYEAEILLSLSNGSTIIYASEEECINFERINQLCLKNKVNVFQATPSKMRMLINQDSGLECLQNFDKMIFSGECMDYNLLKKLRKFTKSKIFDAYAPTETTIWSTVKNITNEEIISVGKPIGNMKVFILDKKRRILPMFTKGELAISGDSVSCGYFENETKTKQAFVNVEFQKDIVYLTGDLALINSNLDLEILNRIDNQIKINGQRIELEEIESLILDNDNISDTAISYRDKNYLVFFYSLKDISKDINLNEIKENLKNKLPIYMVPQIFIKLDKLPYTLNNKKDRKTINNIKVELNNEFEIIEPQTELQQVLLEEISKISTLKPIGINTPISIMGIDSLDSIKMQMGLLKKGVKINYTDLLNNQDIIGLEKYILSNNINFNEEAYRIIDEEYKDILNSDNSEIARDKMKNIILTGATGFLGIHILDEILKNNNESIVYCIIRSKENVKATQRLINNLNFYFDGKYINEIGNRIKVIDLDLLDNNFEEKLNSNVENVNFFIHSAACVKHYGDYEYFKAINVDATENVAKYCLYNNIKLIHASTLSVSGNGFDIGINNQKIKKQEFDEKSLYIGQNISNVYAKTKFEAECLVLKYMKLGLKANILRYGNLTNRITDLKFQKNIEDNAFLDRISTLFKTNVLPESVKDIYLEFTPIDYAALATYTILNNFVDNKVYHIFNNNHVDIIDYINILNKAFDCDINIISNKEFSEVAKKLINSDEEILSKTLVQDLDENYELNYSSNIKVMCEITNEFLRKCGFKWPTIDDRYIIEYINHFKKLGYIK